MIITICGSLKFNDKFIEVQKELESMGHTIYMPTAVQGVDYWSEDSTSRIQRKREQRLIEKHMDKIEKSDAILVINMTKGDIENYIGANTFLEMGFAFYKEKKIFVYNPLPNQKYIDDELLTFNSIVLNRDLILIK